MRVQGKPRANIRVRVGGWSGARRGREAEGCCKNACAVMRGRRRCAGAWVVGGAHGTTISLASMLAPLTKSLSKRSRWPHVAARCRAVRSRCGGEAEGGAAEAGGWRFRGVGVGGCEGRMSGRWSCVWMLRWAADIGVARPCGVLGLWQRGPPPRIEWGFPRVPEGGRRKRTSPGLSRIRGRQIGVQQHK
jgi:hypothetical protein